MAYRIVLRTGARVEHHDAASLDEALDLIEARTRALASGPGRAPVTVFNRTFDPMRQVAHRAELNGGRGERGGVDVRGDGSVEAWTGRWRRRLVRQRDGESAYDALRRTLRG
jgi:hypothetical protein